MRKKKGSSATLVKLEKGAKGILIPRELLESIGIQDGAVVLVEPYKDGLSVRSPSINFAKYIGLLNGKER